METKICENCGAEHDGKYGSGRFCSSKCSRGFSTKAKRKEINEKVSATITDKLLSGERVGCAKIKSDDEKIKLETRLCKECGIIFEVHPIHESHRVYCGKCTFKSKEYREKISRKRIQSMLDGKVIKFGKSKKCTFIFGKQEIRCDSLLEFECLNDLILNNKDKINKIERCDFYITYIDFEGNTRRYIPDFKITCDNIITVVECKYDKLNYRLNEKWKHYVENSSIKKQVLTDFCESRGFNFLWYTNNSRNIVI
jgi:ribosomal protein S27AE